ncbi:sensor histidine kinase [Haploplasma modicum]|uniref:sensor histidine kinase n=1 Tax=Haploplasma modicum TaxID=2150 RepID=UPI00214D0765|nr:sensor histidine kinase [Haploplasma modicum]MCR1809067.1 sensor histidine kinase [Haploplasma modicum]
MNMKIPKSKPLWLIITSTFVLMMTLLVIGIVFISQLTFSRNTNNITKIQAETINEQIVYNFEMYTNDIINISNQIQTLISNENIRVNKDKTLELINTVSYLDPKYEEISIYDLSGNLLVSTNNDSILSDVTKEDWFKEAKLDQTTHFYSRPEYVDGKYKISISKYVPIDKYNEYAILKMYLDFSDLINLADKSNLGNNGHISIINNRYEYIYSSKTSDYTDETEIELFKTTILGNDTVKVNDLHMYFILSSISNTPWRIGVYLNINDNIQSSRAFLLSTTLFTTIFLVISSLIFYSISIGITRPLNKLKDAMSNIERDEKLDLTKVEITYPKEVEILSNNFNIMINRIDNLMNSVIKEKELQRKSELKALQNQINPHFLYNTLDSIVYMVDNNDNKSATMMILALSKLFKISISGGRNIITVKDEISHAESYLLIQQVRYKDKFTYEINIEDESILELKTMKLILQPLIENALYHGINKITDNGKIYINVSRYNELIKFEVIDNGYGMTEEKIKELYQMMDNDDLSDGVGIKNIYQRLKVYYGKSAKLEITSLADEGTSIIILIPVGDENEKNN